MSLRISLRAALLATCLTAPAAAAPAPDAVERATLPNGLRVVIVQDKLAPVVTTEVNYLAGSNDAPPGFPGTAHATEHMMFRGAEGLARDQLAELGAALGGSYNADTTETVTQYFYTAPAEDLPVALHVEALRMRGALMRQADWDKERGAIEQEVSRDLSSPIYKYLSELQAIMFAGTPYEHDALGTRPSFDKTDAALLKTFYDTWYAPNNAILVVVGDVDPKQALDEIKSIMGAVPSHPIPKHATFALQPVKPQTLTLPTDFPVGVVTLAYRMPGLKSHDFATADILGDVLSSQRGALYGLVPAGRALLTEVAYEPKPDVGYVVTLGAFPKGGDAAPLLDDMRGVIANIAAHGVPADLVAAAQRKELAQLAYSADSIAGLAELWSRALAFQGLTSPDELADAYQSVTVDDVNRLARAMLTPDHAVTAILTPQSSGHPITGRGFGGAEAFGIPPEKPVALPEWAASALDKLVLPPPPEPPTVGKLANGITLIVQPEHISHAVSLYGQVRQVADMQEKPGKDGVSQVANELFNYGTQSEDRLAFQKSLDDLAATEEAGPTFAIKVLAPDFEKAVKLLADNELRPAFPAQAFPIVQRQVAQSLAGLLQSPDYLNDRAIARAVAPPGDPTLREATPATVMALKPADLTTFYHNAYRPDLTTIVVVGDITPEEARRVVEENFGDWKAEGPTPHIDLPPVPLSTSSDTAVPDPTSVQDSVTLTESMNLSVTNPDRFVLMLGNTILGGGFFSRLYRDMRIKSGYVYTVESELNWSRTRSDYSAGFGADAQNVSKARDLLVGDIKSMQTSPVTDSELTRAKAMLLRRLPMQRASIAAIAGLDLRLEELGLPLDTPQIGAKRIFVATAPEIQNAFQAYLRPDALAQVVKGPPVVR